MLRTTRIQVYNNLNSEFYATSRKGAIGTYEQNGGSDVDCSSLLIAMLRYLGYDAEYVTGEVTITAQQLIDLTGAKDIATAEKIFLMGNRKVTRINGTVYRFTHTWVKANIDDVEYDLDVYLKKYDRVDGISKIADSEQIKNAASDLKDPADIFTAANSIDVTAVSEDLSITGKAIHQVKISKLPSKVRFEKAGETEKIHDIITSATVQTDMLYLGFNGGYQQSVTAPRSVISSITIGYVPNDSIYDLLGDGSKPKNIYSLSGDYLATYSNAISPALYIDNKIVYEWDGALTKLGEKQTMNIAVVSDGHKYEETKEMLVGTLNALIVDTQNISAQALYTALSRLPETEEDKAKVTENNFFNDEYAGNYLQLVGTTYFAEYDIHSKLLSSAREVYSERELSYGFISYIPEITERFSQVSISKTGSFQFDILGNIRSGVSYNGNADDEKTWRFADGYVSSLLESDVLEQFTGIESVSTAAVLAEAEDENIDIVVINSKNADIISTLELSAHDIQEITNEVNAGNTVITPCKNITVGNWTGTGYIVENETNGSLAFKLSSGLNGGSTTADVVPIMFIDAIISGADLAASIAALCTAVSALLAASTFLPILGSVVMIGLAIYSLYATIDHILTVQGLWEDALDGDQAAIEQIKWECGFNVVISAATFGIGKGASAIANKAAKKTLVKYLGKEAGEAAEVTFKDNLTAAARFAKKASKQGVDEVALHILMQSPDCLGYGKNVLKSLGNLDSLSQTAAAGVLSKNGRQLAKALSNSRLADDAVKFLAKYTDDGAKLFMKHGDDVIKAVNKSQIADEAVEFMTKYTDDGAKLFMKHSDDVVRAVNNSSMADEAVAFMRTYSDDGAEIFIRHGDPAIEAVNKCTKPKAAIRVIKNAGDDFGEAATKAIGTSGDKAVDALTKVPSRDCAELIAANGEFGKELADDVADAISIGRQDAVDAFKRNVGERSTRRCAQLIKNAPDATIAAERAAALKRIDMKGKWASFINDNADDPVFGEYWARAINSCSEGSENEVRDLLESLGKTSYSAGGVSNELNKGIVAKKIAAYGDNAVNGIKNAQSSLEGFIDRVVAEDAEAATKNYMSCVAVDTRTGRAYFGLSGTNTPNPTINNGVVPDGTTDLYEYYKNILNDDMAAARSQGKTEMEKELAALQKNINDVKEAASEKSPFGDSFCEEHAVDNCAEIWASRNAILDGAKLDDLAYRAQITGTKGYSCPCENCVRTFAEHIIIN